MFIRTIKIDCELAFSEVTQELYEALKQFSPFGMGNPEPVFMTKDVVLDDVRVIGKDKKHLKLRVSKDGESFDAIAFGMGERFEELLKAGKGDIAYTIDENEWNGRKSLQLKVKDINIPS